MPFDQNNCALTADCKCAKLMRSRMSQSHDVEYWTCPNWGRSTLSIPMLNHDSAHYTGVTKDGVQKAVDASKRRQDKNAAWMKESSKPLEDIRRGNIRKHLENKGIKVKA